MYGNAPPFARGDFGAALELSSTGTSVNTTERGNLEGSEWQFEDNDYSTQVNGTRCTTPVTVRIVRNVNTTVLLPKRFVKFKSDSTNARIYGNQVDGYGTIGLAGGVVDEFIPSTGVPVGELFQLVVEGPTTVTSDTQGDTTISVGSMVIPGTTGDGKVIDQDTSVAAGANTFAQVNGALGRCKQAVTTTNTDFMIHMRRMGA